MDEHFKQRLFQVSPFRNENLIIILVGLSVFFHINQYNIDHKDYYKAVDPYATIKRNKNIARR